MKKPDPHLVSLSIRRASKLARKISRRSGRSGRGAFKRKDWARGVVVKSCMDGLYSKRRQSFLGLSPFQRNLVTLPKIFSFIEDPDSAIQALDRLISIGMNDTNPMIFFDHSSCEQIDLGASAVMDVITMELRDSWLKKGVKPGFGGRLPEDQRVKEILCTSGIVKHLNISVQQSLALENYFLFPLIKGRKESPSPFKSSENETAAQMLTEYFDACLKRRRFSLTRGGIRKVSHMLGEMLTNAEEHSGTGQWYVIGHLRKDQQHDEVNVAIFNFGKTIFQTLAVLEDGSKLRAQLNQLTAHHQTKGLWASNWTPENLWTLYSLQEGVSRYSDMPEGVDRGNGTVRMIEFFQQLGQRVNVTERPMMCLISGSTYILFDSVYSMRSENFGSESREIIAFNSKNDLFEKPDKNNVRELDGHFPGTIISMKFFIDPMYLQSSTQGSNAN